MTSSSNWARRYGPHNRRLCARPGCGSPAAATLRFQPTQREAWLVDLDDDGARTEGDLCARHAAGLVLPRGWQLHDSLASSRSASSEPVPTAPRARRTSIPRVARRRRSQASAVALPGLSVVEEPAEPVVPAEPVEPVASVAPVAEPEARAEPAPLVAAATAEESEALAETLDAQTPLLRRAFTNVRPPESDS
jgi:hypothetical protein